MRPQVAQAPGVGVRFRLAGSGWYETDFKSDKEAKRNLHEKADKDEAKADGSGGSEAGTKSEAKDAAKPDAKAIREERFREERLFRADRKRQTQPRQPAGHHCWRSKSNGRTKPARRAPAVRRRGR